MKTLADRFRKWYDYERDCTAKTLEMLASVPSEKQADALFQKAIDKFAHVDAARLRWLHRLGHWPELPPPFPAGLKLEDLPARFAESEAAWNEYLSKLDDAEVTKEVEYSFSDGSRYRWTVEGVLTTLFGHAQYHRGQVVTYVTLLGGKAVDTDYVFFSKPTKLPG